jgi:hypothetical protein
MVRAVLAALFLAIAATHIAAQSPTFTDGVQRVLIGGNPIGAVTMAIRSTVGRQVVDLTG